MSRCGHHGTEASEGDSWDRPSAPWRRSRSTAAMKMARFELPHGCCGHFSKFGGCINNSGRPHVGLGPGNPDPPEHRTLPANSTQSRHRLDGSPRLRVKSAARKSRDRATSTERAAIILRWEEIAVPRGVSRKHETADDNGCSNSAANIFA